jgi:hypothetical protein
MEISGVGLIIHAIAAMRGSAISSPRYARFTFDLQVMKSPPAHVT